jgi:hypothetical protein
MALTTLIDTMDFMAMVIILITVRTTETTGVVTETITTIPNQPIILAEQVLQITCRLVMPTHQLRKARLNLPLQVQAIDGTVAQLHHLVAVHLQVALPHQVDHHLLEVHQADGTVVQLHLPQVAVQVAEVHLLVAVVHQVEAEVQEEDN